MEIILRLVLLLLVISMPSIACNVSRTRQPPLIFPTETPIESLSPTIPSFESVTVSPSALVMGEQTRTPVPPTEIVPPTASATPQPYCSVLINVRLRSGPGVDFQHLTTLYVGDLLVPFAYVPQGRTEGAWVKIYLSDNPDRIGWVIANSNIIACNVDITELPAP
jgi:hypothetical protein